ncbi:MAG: Phenylalanyl-tRNA synthetase beta chain, partial [uncultured Sphingomonadaceae bacterium]
MLTAEPHPQADKLQLLAVDTGSGDPAQVVCGAPNARAGLVGVFGGPGAYVPGSDLTLKVATIRGVESRGMMCSARELQLGDDHAGIIELPADAPVGASYAAWAGLDDPVIDVAITPNRGDAMGVHGIARDLAAAGLGTLKRGTSEHVARSLGAPPQVRTDDPDGCPAFWAQAVRGVLNRPSPDWLQRLLRAVGQRPISVLVDITNYVTIGWGRPLHVYDMAKLSGPLVARKARAGETIEALNGRTYTLDETMTVIADDVAVHDIGGIMGGTHSGVSDTTTDVLIECAWFDPETIARTGQKLALTSDARTRFERGVDPRFLADGLALATGMVIGLAGGAASEPVRAGTPPDERATIAYRPDRVESLAGMTVPADEQRRVLERLGFTVEGDEDWRVTPPSWRRDVDGPADIVEEIVRIAGLNRVPSTPLPRAPGVARPTATPAQRTERRMRRAAAARGLNEAVTWSFVSRAEADAFGGGVWTLANPISEELKVMRPSLLPGLVSAARRNRARGEASVRLFEIGRRYLDDTERPTLGLVLAGERTPRGWRTGRAANFDAYDAKAEALALLAEAGAPVANLQLLGDAPPHFHPGRSARLCLGPKTALATFGELHPATLRALDIDGPVMAAEIFLDAIPQPRDAGRRRPAFDPPLQQAITRDFAFVVDRAVPAETLVRAVRGADKAAIVDVRLFDRFTGAGIDEGAQSLAIEVTLQPAERSFTDAEIAEISARIVAAAEKVGGRLRG